MDLRLGAIDATNVNRFRGRKREEQLEKSQAIQIYQIYGKESTYAWEMHKHVEGKSGFVSHKKHTAKATNIDLFHS